MRPQFTLAPFAFTLAFASITFVGMMFLGLATKARACTGVGQEERLGITSHAPRNVGQCEAMNPHIPK
jgi:hypothetical protein